MKDNKILLLICGFLFFALFLGCESKTSEWRYEPPTPWKDKQQVTVSEFSLNGTDMKKFIKTIDYSQLLDTYFCYSTYEMDGEEQSIRRHTTYRDGSGKEDIEKSGIMRFGVRPVTIEILEKIGDASYIQSLISQYNSQLVIKDYVLISCYNTEGKRLPETIWVKTESEEHYFISITFDINGEPFSTDYTYKVWDSKSYLKEFWK